MGRAAALAALTLGVIASVGLAGTPGAARAQEPAPAVRDFGAVSYLGRPAVDKAGNVRLTQPKARRATAADAEECLTSPGANTAMGRVHNRFVWCQRWTLNAVRGTAGPGVPGGIKLAEMNMNYDAVAYGRDDGRRGVTIFFKSTKRGWW